MPEDDGNGIYKFQVMPPRGGIDDTAVPPALQYMFQVMPP